jgi:hypothetical protein
VLAIEIEGYDFVISWLVLRRDGKDGDCSLLPSAALGSSTFMSFSTSAWSESRAGVRWSIKLWNRLGNTPLNVFPPTEKATHGDVLVDKRDLPIAGFVTDRWVPQEALEISSFPDFASCEDHLVSITDPKNNRLYLAIPNRLWRPHNKYWVDRHVIMYQLVSGFNAPSHDIQCSIRKFRGISP